jgi:hypothetical protein
MDEKLINVIGCACERGRTGRRSYSVRAKAS